MSTGHDEPGVSYVPDLDAEEVERIRQWHDAAHEDALTDAGTRGQRFMYLGLELYVPPQVHPITSMSHLLGEAVVSEVVAAERVLDMGTGCGVNAILAARAGAEVLAVDLNPEAVGATADNAERNGVSDRVQARVSDVFDRVDIHGDGPFDLVVFDPPYRWFEPRDLLEMATADPGYRALTSFMREARAYLSEQGRILLAFGSSGDIGYVRRLISEEKFAADVLAQKKLVTDQGEIEYVVYRLAP